MLYSPLRGHRLEIYLLLLLIFTYLSLFKIKFQDKRFKTENYSGAIAAGITGAMLLLVRMESSLIITIGIIYIFFHITKKRRLKTLLFILLPMITLAGPFYLNCKLEKGSFFYVINRHSKFYTKYEKPRSEPVDIYINEADKDISGKDTTLAGYILKSRGISGMFKRFAGGYFEALTKAGKHLFSTPVNMGFLLYFVWAGLLTMFFFKPGRILLFWGLLYLLPHSFILPARVAGRSSVDIRFAGPITPLFAFAVAGLVYALLNFKRGSNKKTNKKLN
ncbi:MAG: hypothetical protein PF545_05340 [Elusimicrobia bacterium]|jgi:hypothetical protein|nr:hypothetical protein [Elusimicrobiota bacterium]